MEVYNSTPHFFTGKTPSEHSFKRIFSEQIPGLHYFSKQFLSDEDVRQRDIIEKEKGNQYTDKMCHAKESNLSCGEKVYIKNMVKKIS